MNEKGRFRGKTGGVFPGGESAEGEVSLRTGGAAASALRRKGYPVVEIDIRGDWLSAIRKAEIDVAFIALHGRLGEDGCIQGALELARVPYTGSGVAASAVSMSKVLAKRVVAAVGVPCAPDTVFAGGALGAPAPPRGAPGPRAPFLEGGPPPAPAPPAFGFPLVVKPDREGSTVGVSVVRDLG